MGDLVYSLLFAKKLGVENYLIDGKRGVCKFNEASRKFISPLIRNQQYIKSVLEFDGQSYDCDYGVHPNGEKVVVGTNLTKYHSSKFNIDWKSLNDPWLTSDTIDLGKKIVINRTSRYHGNYLFYHDFFRHVDIENCVFVGVEEEWKQFVHFFQKPIDFYKTDNVLELASAINGCEMFLGNESLPCAIATGLGKHSFIEIGIGCANYIFNNKKLNYF